MKLRMQQFARLALMWGCAAALCQAANLEVWTSAASAGTVDETSTALVRLVQGEATLLPAAPVPSTATIRYNIVALDGLFGRLTPTSYPDIAIRYRDNGVNAQVLASVKAYDYTSGITSTLATFDSNLYPGSAAYQTRTFGNCGTFTGYDFSTKAYFIEVQILKSGAGGDPGVGVLVADRYGVCPR